MQGVGFRWSTHNRANELKINGAVRNNPDGSVTIVACGDAWQLEQWLRDGDPRFAKIEEFSTKEIDLQNLPTDFEIK